MSVLATFLKNKVVQVFKDSDFESADRLSPFVWSDVFLRDISDKPERLLLHIWPMSETVILGMVDKRLPYLEDGLKILEQQGYYPVVRNIGGLAVVADEGVLNFSLIFSQKESPLSINDGYDVMMTLISELFWDSPQEIEAYEISHSYCPGDYDLSVDGQKIAGLAQRRIKNGVLVSIYLSVNGNQEKRGRLIHDFYDEAKKGEETKSFYPEVWPESMTTLSEVYGREWTVAEVCERLLEVLSRYAKALDSYQLGHSDIEAYNPFYQEMIKRNQEVMSW